MPEPQDKSECCWYFAYGSNMQRDTFERRRGMRPTRSRWAWLAGHGLCFDLPVGPGERGVANLIAAEGADVYGVLYEITAAELETLDRTEGVHVEFYVRVKVAVAAADGERVEAWTYVSERRSTGRKPSERYLGLLLEGAREHALPQDYVRRLEAFELAHDERVVKA